MSNTKTSPPDRALVSEKPAEEARTPQPEPSPAKGQKDSLRETMESVVVAFLLAFLVRTFEAEAFVIPTGSMAPTLLGRHKDIECEQCGTHYTVSASDELDRETGTVLVGRIDEAVCPNCRFKADVTQLPVFKGDRILVNKYPFEFGDPQRWDVVVFKFPEEPTTNYIKRLVGLPGETLRIERGDVYARDDKTGEFRILRKDDPEKQEEVLILVYDNDRPAAALQQQGVAERWSPMQHTPDGGETAGWSLVETGWQPKADERAFQLDSLDPKAAPSWLRYRHLLPPAGTWQRPGDWPAQVKPQLISDFCGYNAYEPTLSGRPHVGLYWVGDLVMSCEVTVEETDASGELILELVEGVRRYRARITAGTGEARLVYLDDFLNRGRDEEIEIAAAPTRISGPGTYAVRFANVDDRLSLWVDGALVSFDQPTTYRPAELPSAQPSDLVPAGIAGSGLRASVAHLRLDRDIYYRGERVDPDDYSPHPRSINEYPDEYADRLEALLDDPEAWDREYRQHVNPTPFGTLGDDEFFMMGDNSPLSLDSRLWSNARHAENRHAVPRNALVGKAFFIYWPHGVPFMNDGRGYAIDLPPVRQFFYHKRPNGELVKDYPAFTVPFYPQFGRMERIR